MTRLEHLLSQAIVRGECTIEEAHVVEAIFHAMVLAFEFSHTESHSLTERYGLEAQNTIEALETDHVAST